MRPLHASICALLLLSLTAGAPPPDGGDVSGALRRWHPVTITFEGPRVGEADAVNPFRNYRLEVVFEHAASGERVRVPGYFAADGRAAETGATAGSAWRVHFTPARTGRWSYEASFRTGTDVALSLEPLAGVPTAFDGAAGTFEIAETDKAGRDHRGRGLLRYVGARYLRFDDGTWFLKGGADSPETLLAYEDFDGTVALAPPGVARSGEAHTASLKRYASHVADWRPGDPTWRGGMGKGLVGALNYLASEGMNAVSFLTMNVEGDGQNVFPWTGPDERDRYDVSKLAQWDVVFSHADSLGLFLHFKTQETENDRLLDGGRLGPERRLYYRELVARFGHHLALNWNLGEENDLWEELEDPDQTQVRAHAAYLQALDPYDHPIVIHSYPNQQEEVYRPLLGDASVLAGASVQTRFDRVHEDTRRWIAASEEAGRPWVVANDEQGDASTGVKPDGEGHNHDAIRRHVLWGNLMAGGAGVEYYFGYDFAQNDLNAEDWRSRDRMWDYTRHALAFFRAHLPFPEMEGADALTPAEDDYVFARPGAVYAVYLPDGGPAVLELGEHAGTYEVRWFDPRAGGALQDGSVARVRGPGRVDLGRPPAQGGGDWVVLVRRPTEER